MCDTDPAAGVTPGGEESALAPVAVGRRRGRPKGSRNKTALAVEAVFDGAAEALMRKLIDTALGLVFGFVSSSILVCCVMTSLSVIVPKIWSGYNRNALTLPFDKYPIQVYERIEEGWLGIQKTDPGHTRFPTFEKENVDDFQKYWTSNPEKYWERGAGS